ncbi:hypothetical protein TraAM80_00798 [Trypanosoma rangeli]|uniref:Uncharacterized protein n=1 Tax=Trypanosoma rangeli TaxID=5698 RepID=A0A3R7P290_TRYRA|nr:uncharacterized protein TraAM80_00798 [Trypanosoma rangeli]RNF11606.1 hypothetical protein TraAM80_00798 [Trypanosoma rangeli]|eukprot:RNF11606.1 hypothetical protein TraAM80_00798 [Trypanosoma rangeli]
MGDAGDVNQMLLAASTASAEGVKASERWLLGAKKRGDSAASKTTRKKARTEVHTHTETDVGDKPAENNGGGSGAREGNKEISAGHDISAPEALVHRLITYVFEKCLGGRHNASRGDEADFEPPPRAALFAESSAMRPAAAFAIHHAVYGGSSMTQSERVAEAILQHRRRLHVCSYDRDLVGGFIDGKPFHTRRHLLSLVTKGLRGESMTKPPQICRGAEAKEEKKQEAVVLFGDAKGKSLSSFLQDSSSSSSDGEEDS